MVKLLWVLTLVAVIYTIAWWVPIITGPCEIREDGYEYCTFKGIYSVRRLNE